MLRRGPLTRSLVGVGLACAAVLVLAGGLALRGPALVAVAAAGVLAGCLAAGMTHEQPGRDRWAMLEAAVLAGGATVGGLLVLCGCAALFGNGPTAALAGIGGSLVAVVWLVRRARTAAAVSGAPRPASAPLFLSWWGAPGTPSPAVPQPAVVPLLPPVEQLTTRALGREWLRTTAALASQLEPLVHESLARRREDALDELERRDPDGFARWLAAGPVPGSDPADWLGTDAAGSPEAA